MSDESNITVHKEQDWFIRTRNIIYYILGVIEVLLAFRLIFKLLGASTRSGLVVFIYSLTGNLILPFSGIFGTAITRSAAVLSIFESATVIAMIVYGLIAYGIVRLIKLKT